MDISALKIDTPLNFPTNISETTVQAWMDIYVCGGTPESRKACIREHLQERQCPEDEVESLLDWCEKSPIPAQVGVMLRSLYGHFAKGLIKP